LQHMLLSPPDEEVFDRVTCTAQCLFAVPTGRTGFADRRQPAMVQVLHWPAGARNQP